MDGYEQEQHEGGHAIPEAIEKVQLQEHIGFDSITGQMQRKFMKRGFDFNIMVVGPSGLGKSTFVNTLFSSHLIEPQGLEFRYNAEEPSPKPVDILPTSFVLEENGVEMKLTVIDTPGYGDNVNNDNCWENVIRYIRDQHASYLKRELSHVRERFLPDTRVHCVLYFIPPTGHSLRPIDIHVMKKIAEISNVVPVIAKADCMTLSERVSFKERIRDEIDFHQISTFPQERTYEERTAEEEEEYDFAKSIIPFAVVGSESIINVNGREIRGRKLRSGVVDVDNEEHCDFVHLKNFLTKTHLVDLIETTVKFHYEQYRTKQLLELRELSQQQQQQAHQAQQQSQARQNVPTGPRPIPHKA